VLFRGGKQNKVDFFRPAEIRVNTPFSDQFINFFPGTDGPSPVPPSRSVDHTNPIFFVRQDDAVTTGTLSNSLWGGELNARGLGGYFGPMTLGGLLGARYLDFREDLNLYGQYAFYQPTGVPNPINVDPVPGVTRTSTLANSLTMLTRDRVWARNRFFGGQLGVDLTGQCGPVWLNLLGKVALGDMHQVGDVLSTTTTTTVTTEGATPVITTTSGGLLATPTTTGHFTRNKIAVVPELNLKLGYECLDCLLFYAGYDLLYASSVIRPGDLSVPVTVTSTANLASTANTVTVQQPTIQFGSSHLWVQGFNFGLQLRY
jgi:hypothetical protein